MGVSKRYACMEFGCEQAHLLSHLFSVVHCDEIYVLTDVAIWGRLPLTNEAIHHLARIAFHS